MSTARCSVRSALLDEPLVGTASRIHRYVLLESPGPWGVEALRDARLPADLKRELRRRSRSTGVRILLIRRFGRQRGRRSPYVFVVDTDPVRPSVAAGRLSDHREVLDLHVWTASAGSTGGLERHDDPLFLVCTHGRHDPCCAERGRPLARALSAAFPAETWECSHLGGDRFAGNLLCLPHGVSYGRIAPEDAAGIASEYVAGRLNLAHLRGRGSYPFAVQAAEWQLRRSRALTGVDDLVLTAYWRDAADTTAVFSDPGGAKWSVRIRTARAPAHRLTCKATETHAAPRFELLTLDLIS